MSQAFLYRISTLLYAFDAGDRVLMLERSREPNRGLWSPPGGKLKMASGESPWDCARREAQEELGIRLASTDLRLTGIVSEYGYEGSGHWLMFLFEILPRVEALPPPMDEGRFVLVPRSELDSLSLPQTDREVIWPLFWQHRGGFFAAHCRCNEDGSHAWTLEASAPVRSPAEREGCPSGQELATGGGTRPDAIQPQESSGALIDLTSDHYYMGEAIRQARRAYDAEEVPVGAVIVRGGRIVARAFNQVELLKDATAHAEMLAITQAEADLGDWRLNECTLYVTKEPCPMCAGAIVHSRLGRVVYGAADSKAGCAGSALNLLQFPSFNHRCEITAAIREDECRQLLKSFFARQRVRVE